MSSTTNPTDFSDLYTELLNRTRSVTGVTAVTNQAKRYINTALQDMAMGFEYKMPWLERDAVIRTRAAYTTGTLTVTKGSTAVTGASTVWSTTDAFGLANAREIGKMLIAGNSEIYTIASTSGAGTMTLDDKYISADSTTATYIYFEDEYALASDFLKPLDWRMFSPAMGIELIPRNEFRRQHPRPNVSGTPAQATLIDKGFGATTTPVLYVQFYPYPSAVKLIPYTYITNNLAVSSAGVAATALSADADEPNMPLRYRMGIIYHALMQWYRDKKDDARAQQAQADYVDFVNRVVSDQNMGAPTVGQLVPDRRSGRSFSKRPYSGSGRGFSTNNNFDDFRS